jgi:hypothetical protein
VHEFDQAVLDREDVVRPIALVEELVPCGVLTQMGQA